MKYCIAWREFATCPTKLNTPNDVLLSGESLGPSEWSAINNNQAGNATELRNVERTDSVPQRESRCGNQQIMRADYRSARFQIRPNPGKSNFPLSSAMRIELSRIFAIH
jgi:hypothetical protein